MPQFSRNHAEENERRHHVRRAVQLRLVHLRDRRRVADVIDVRVRHQQHVHLAQLGEILVLRRRLRPRRQPGIDHDHLAARRFDPPARLPEPQQLGLALRKRGSCARQQNDKRQRDFE